MSFGWSANDIVALARLSFEIYSFCNGAPDELRGLFNKFHTTGQNLNRLATILEASGLGEWHVNHDLRTDLESCRDDLQKYSYVVDETSSPFIKVKGLAHLAISQDKLKRIEKRIESSNAIINEVKMDLVLACSLKNLQITSSSAPTSVTGSPPIAFDHMGLGINHTSGSIPAISGSPAPALLLPPPSVHDVRPNETTRNAISSAEHMLATAYSRRRGSTGTVSFGHRDHQTDDVLSEIASLAEEIELYAENANVVENTEQLNKIVTWAKTFERRYSYGGLSSITKDQRNSQLPSNNSTSGSFDNVAPGPNSGNRFSVQSEATQTTIPSVSGGSRTTRLSGGLESELWSQPWTPGKDIQQSLRSSDRSVRDIPVISEPRESRMQLSEENVVLSDRARASLTINNRDAQDCSFFLSTSEGSLVLTVTCQSVVTGPGFRNDRGQHCWSFQHCITTGTRPIPHLLHPSVEGPCTEPQNPYTITFTDDQFVSLANSAQDKEWLTSLKYIFFSKQDRDIICSHIFGKTLLMSFGCSEIRYDGRLISHMPMVILWRDEYSAILSITFPPNLVDASRKDTELQVTGLWNAEKAKIKKTTKNIDLSVEKLSRSDVVSSPDWSCSSDRRNSSVSSTGSLFRRRFSSLSHEEKLPIKQKCVLTFSDLNDQKYFLGHVCS